MEKYKNTFDTVNTRILMEISLGISVYYFFNYQNRKQFLKMESICTTNDYNFNYFFDFFN